MQVSLPKSSKPSSPPENRLGFLAAGFDSEFGYIGGLLLTTGRGRPLEFHYTTPVQPSATHKILYGAELEPYIFEKLIAHALLGQCSAGPRFLVTDQPLVLGKRPELKIPLVCLAASSREELDADLQTHPGFPEDKQFVERWIANENPSVVLSEPLQRIWEASREVLARDGRMAA